MEAVIEVEALTKTYPDGTQAVSGVSLEVQRGECFGFLGPNGAGKSTTIKILTTLLEKTAGEVRLFGLDATGRAEAIRRRIGYAAQETGIDDDLTGRENLTLQGRLFHLPRAALKERVAELLELMDLTGDAERAAGSYSGGMRKRLDLATALIHQPEVLFLDEPTTGLDPQTRASLWHYLERLNREGGLTLFLTTHYMEEADHLCGRLTIIDHGQIIAEGSPAALKAQLGGDLVSLGLPASEQPQGEAVVRNLGLAQQVTRTESGLQLIVEDGAAALPKLLHALDGADLKVTQITLTSPTLDDVFLKYTGASIRREEAAANWRGQRGGPFASRRRG